MRYPIVLLDVGETLVGPRESFGAVYARVLEGLGLNCSAVELERALRAAWREFDGAIPPGIDRYRHFPGGENEYWQRFARATLDHACGDGLPDGLAESALPHLRDAFLDADAWIIYDDVLPALERLRTQGTRLGVVSNWDSRLPSILATLGLDGFFETVVVSHLEGVEKPDPALFRVALQRMKGDHGDALHVGDRPELDLAGARAAGLDAVVVDRRRRLDGTCPTVPDLSGLPGLARHGLGEVG